MAKRIGKKDESSVKVAGADAPTGDDKPNWDKALRGLRKAPLTLTEVATLAGVKGAAAQAWIDAERDRGLNLHKAGAKWSLEQRTPAHVYGGQFFEITSDDDDSFLIGALGDSHLCSTHERLDVLHDLYDQYEAEGVKDVFHTGNWVEGEARFNKFEIHTHGMDAQLRYLAEQYPRRPGITTHAVAGDDHEGWYEQNAGVDIGKYAQNIMREAGRQDWHHLGFMEAYVKLVNRATGRSSMMAVVHPGGGSSYALSYTIQKIVESYSGGEKPAVLLAGHYHKMELAVYRNVFCIQTGCQQDQTCWARKKRIEPHLGGHVLRMRQDPATGAIVEVNGFKRYFNIGYYNDRWSHSGPVTLPRVSLGGVA